MQFRKIGVLGAGVMGIGVTQNLAQTNHEVVLVDLSEQILEKAKMEIKKNLRFQVLFNKTANKADPDEILNRIQFTTDYNALTDVNYLIENVTEKWEVKKEVYSKIDKICKADCIFASNTSAISITRMGAVTQRPALMIGIHFMNPVPMKKTVEVIRGFHTSEETIEHTKAMLDGMGKKYVVVNDYPGFVSNRVLMLTINEAIFLVQDQVASAEEVDQIFRECFEHKIGPLETGDLIGLDTILLSLEVLYESYNDPKYRPAPLLRKMVDAGLHGRKSGQGFYLYQVD